MIAAANKNKRDIVIDDNGDDDDDDSDERVIFDKLDKTIYTKNVEKSKRIEHQSLRRVSTNSKDQQQTTTTSQVLFHSSNQNINNNNNNINNSNISSNININNENDNENKNNANTGGESRDSQIEPNTNKLMNGNTHDTFDHAEKQLQQQEHAVADRLIDLVDDDDENETRHLLGNSETSSGSQQPATSADANTRSLYLIDVMLSVLLFSPMSCFYWYGTEQILDTYFITNNYILSNFVSWFIGLAILLPAYLFQQEMQTKYEEARTWRHCGSFVRFLMRVVYMYLICFAVVIQWRGVWNLMVNNSKITY